MTTFANAFWGGGDYAAGLGVLFSKLQQGVQENQQMLTVARMRAEAEDLYATRLGEIDYATNRISGGFQRDDGASVKKAYDGVRTEMSEAARNHKKIASNIRELVVSPFGRWSEQHAVRVQNSQDDLQMRLRAHDKQAEVVRTCRSQYYNKCRRVEDLDEEEKLAFQDPSTSGLSTPKSSGIPSVKLSEPEPQDLDPIDLGDETYSPERLKMTLTHMLENIRLGETKVPILGTYSNVSTGAEIVEYIQKNLSGTSVAYAERIGQDLIANGLLRLVGNVGSTFANSSKMSYQWRPKVFQITGLPEKKGLGRSATTASDSSFMDNPSVGAVGEMLQGWNPLNNPHPNETAAEKLRREAGDSDERYKAAVKKLDTLRCSLEEAMIEHLRFMEQCELDRLKAIKSVILDFSGAVSNVIPSLQSSVDNMMLFQETIQPAADLRWILENYRTGSFVPKVTVYENYYNQIGDQIFGVDIESRAKTDRKRIPALVTTLLLFLDNKYPELEGDEARRGIWLVDVPLAASHHLRNAIEREHSAPYELLDRYDVPIVASVLKLYLLQLPDSLVSSSVYEIVKTIYTTTAQSTDEQTRVSVIQSTLGQLRLANIASLDAIITHLTRLIDLTSADDVYVNNLAAILAPCILRPKQENSLTVTEKFNIRLVKDLLAHKDAIFGQLKRAASGSAPNPQIRAPPRDRVISRDESGRKEAMEERQRALQANKERIRDKSPNRLSMTPSGAMGHRRERSTSAETRFPIATANHHSPITNRTRNGSLDVPTSPPKSAEIEGHAGGVNGTRLDSTYSFSAPPPPPKDSTPTKESNISPMTTTGQQPGSPAISRSAATQQSQPDASIPGRLTTDSAHRRGESTASAASVQLGSTLNFAGDFISPSQYYNYTGTSEQDPTSQRNSIASSTADLPSRTSTSNDDPPSQAPTTNGGTITAQVPTSSLSRHGPANTSSKGSISSLHSRTASELDKRNSLTRSTGTHGRSSSRGPSGLSRRGGSSASTTGSLQRSGFTQRDVGGASAGADSGAQRRGVELVDRPMDD